MPYARGDRAVIDLSSVPKDLMSSSRIPKRMDGQVVEVLGPLGRRGMLVVQDINGQKWQLPERFLRKEQSNA